MTTAGLARNTADWSSASVAASVAVGEPAARRWAIAPTIHALAIVLIVLSLAPPAWTNPRGREVRRQAWGWTL
jgi:hypothetical protein